MNRRSFIAACCGAAVAPFVKAEPLGLRKHVDKFAQAGFVVKNPVGIGPFRPDKTFTHGLSGLSDCFKPAVQAFREMAESLRADLRRIMKQIS